VLGSAQNPHVAAARSLLTRRGRTAASSFLVEGPHAVGEVLAGDHAVRELFVTDAAADREIELMRTAATRRIPVRVVTEKVLARLGDTVTPQGLVAVVALPSVDLAGVLAASPRLLVVLDTVADPGNAGTVIRTADAIGADAVVLSEGSVDVYGGKVVRAAAGSLLHLPVVPGADADATVEALRAAGITVLATAAAGEDSLDDLMDTDALAGPTAWLLGNEAHGLPKRLLDAADRRVRVPLRGRAESLNLAATAAICLHATSRAQNRTGQPPLRSIG
jgi:RNA methyltransferase, TrmH family